MPQNYSPQITRVGLAKLTNASLLGKKLTLSHMAVGDGSGSTINLDATKLEHEVYRAPINEIRLDDNAADRVLAVLVIPIDAGGFNISELGLFDSDGELIAVSRFPATYKPRLAEGTGREISVRMKLQLSNVDVIKLQVDPTAVLATQHFVGESLKQHEAKKHPVKWSEVVEKPNVFPPSRHNHNEAYYTQAQVDTLLAVSGVPRGGCVWFDGAINSSGRPLDPVTKKPMLAFGVCDGRTYEAPDGRRVSTPNARDRFIVAAGGKYKVRNVGGAEHVTLSVSEIPPHDHSLILAGYPDGAGALDQGSYPVSGKTGVTGSGQSHENRPPYLGLFLIKRL
ncbi:phage tail-collar fiber domain-containing protein [Halodesulfovibrio marinisediminis]|uniref:Phage tail-collar fibre protein n=1 Tax=Halodesulfovibrio marinisediminis DSM 17456 TaxID=1121457 RepID=A0A1N6I1A6_9BACT|nr:phage tail protein [Halodesulfovibrio marinisediminis]SIO25773.1 Phage tail-collar fibre protein [Halodesulfovibrio marinisediminis DSM 17456]